MITRPKGDICWSDDGGRTWTDPVSIGVKLFDPHLLMMPNGVLTCFQGSYQGGALRVPLSFDNGCTWHGPEEAIGYSIDTSVYGYSHPMLLHLLLERASLKIQLQATENKAATPALGLVHQLFVRNQAHGEGGEGTQALVKSIELLAGK